MNNLLIDSKFEQLPENLKSEVMNFIDFLLAKNEPHTKQKPVFGGSKGFFKMKKKFDDPMEDFQDYQ